MKKFVALIAFCALFVAQAYAEDVALGDVDKKAAVEEAIADIVDFPKPSIFGHSKETVRNAVAIRLVMLGEKFYGTSDPFTNREFLADVMPAVQASIDAGELNPRHTATKAMQNLLRLGLDIVILEEENKLLEKAISIEEPELLKI